MTNMVRRYPFNDLRSTVDRFFDESFARPWRFVATAPQNDSTFPVEFSQTENKIELKASLPGIKPEDVEITVANDVLTIKAEHREELTEEKRDFHRREIRYGSFQRAFNLPVSVDADKAEATFEDGMLHLTLPKAESDRPKQIKVGGTQPAVSAGTTSDN